MMCLPWPLKKPQEHLVRQGVLVAVLDFANDMIE